MSESSVGLQTDEFVKLFMFCVKDEYMRSITMVLKSSETATVRKAVMAAGASLAIVTPVTRRNGSISLMGWYCEGASSGVDRPVRLEVVAEVAKLNNIVSAILANAWTGGIENIVPFPVGKPPQTVLGESQREEARKYPNIRQILE